MDPAKLEGAVLGHLGEVGPDGEETYDPARHGQELAKKQIGHRSDPDSLALR